MRIHRTRKPVYFFAYTHACSYAHMCVYVYTSVFMWNVCLYKHTCRYPEARNPSHHVSSPIFFHVIFEIESPSETGAEGFDQTS